MDIVLISPANSRYYSEALPSVPEYSCPPLGLCYLAGDLRSRGYQVGIVDLAAGNRPPSDLAQYLHLHQPRIVGITGATPSFPNALRTAATVKQAIPSACVVLGGPHVTARPQEALDNPSVDCVVMGEGEEALASLADSLIRGKLPLAKVPGLSRRGDAQNLLATYPPEPVHDLDGLSYPARDLIDLHSYAQSGAMLTSRGCSRRCIFCACGLGGTRPFRLRSARAVVEEMLYLRETFGVTRFEFHDDAFTTDVARAHDICRLVRDTPSLADAQWGCQALASRFDESLAHAMADAGCLSVQFGVESGNPDVLKRTGKGISTGDAEKAVRAAHSAGIRTIVTSFIIGFPWDTADTIHDTLAFALRLRQLGATHTPCSVLTPFPGTPVGDNPDRYGVRIVDQDWERYTFNQVLIETAHFTAGALREAYAEVVFRLMDVQV